ncbi:MAG: hypothetical protein AB2L11_04820 [Syntrophobacteraceae bacterium]
MTETEQPVFERFKFMALGFSLSLAVLICTVFNSYAADPKTPRIQTQAEINILYVDKFGVYGPNVIFYWDTAMSKQKLDAMMKTADRLRNKQAVVTYSTVSDLNKDKRPLIVDLVSAQTFEWDQTKNVEMPELEPQDAGASAYTGGSGLPLNDYSRKRLYDGQKPFIDQQEDEPREDTQALSKEQPASKPLSKSTEPVSRPLEPIPISREEIAGFIEQVLIFNERKDITSALACYGDQVNYYDRGVVNKDYIRRDLLYYFKNWDRISTSLDGGVVLIVTDQYDMRIVKFNCSYLVENSNRVAKGKTENIWKIQRVNNRLKIIDMKQKVYNSENQAGRQRNVN